MFGHWDFVVLGYGAAVVLIGIQAPGPVGMGVYSRTGWGTVSQPRDAVMRAGYLSGATKMASSTTGAFSCRAFSVWQPDRGPAATSFVLPSTAEPRLPPGSRMAESRGSSPRIAAHDGSILAGPHCLALRSCYAYPHVRCSSNPQRAVLPHVVPAPIEQVVLDKRQVSNS